ncbi:hypothetical protein FAGAP_12345 [Fusarium agapanthi]|uniref:Uncharacterized protein n=1 Tax=Fusarium agapanthi TaxID=1803897 RepID=A0A9P5AXL3_9HYPO|nr:hypothetical protein FAGAP_12345 [Fusarium agapanthi]
MKSPESSMPREGVKIDIDMIEETRSSNLALQVSHSFGHKENENGRGKKKTKYTTDLEMSPRCFLNTEEKKPTTNNTLGCGTHAHGSGQPTLKVIRNLASATPMDPLSSWLSNRPSEDPWSVLRIAGR